METSTTRPTRSDSSIQQLRVRLAISRTRTINDDIFDKITGEYYGSYISSPYLPTSSAEKPIKLSVKRNWHIIEDGSPLPQECKQPPEYLAPVVVLIQQRPIEQPELNSRTGKKPQVINNPLATALITLKLEGWSTPWLDDFTYGAINTGPGVINGRQSVALSDVKKLLRLPEFSIAIAAEHLLNHDRQPMGTRQLQRVVEAARTALRGIALHLERHPVILRSIDVEVDFNKLWSSNDDQAKADTLTLPTKKQQALEMIMAGIPTKTIARKLGISKNTVKKWGREKQAAEVVAEREGGGQ
jgi:hypothetical protein